MKNKEKFITYCKGKIRNLGEVTYTNSLDEKVTLPVIIKADIREFSNVKVLLPEEDEGLLVVNRNNRVVIDTPMISPIEYASRMQFTYIDEDFYSEILDLWDEYDMEEMMDDYEDEA